MAYSTKHGKGLKAEHWTSASIQMHTVVSYHDWDEHIKPKVDPCKRHSARKMEVDYFMSNDKHHDAFYVADNQDKLEDKWDTTGEVENFIISDGGPNHYKCRQNWANLAERKGNRKRSAAEMADCQGQPEPEARFRKQRRCIHQSIRGENHGKGVGDGFNATGKACFGRHERRDINNDEDMTVSHINNASDCVRVGNKDQEKKRKADGWQEDTPQAP
jgi:hypothetical protein